MMHEIQFLFYRFSNYEKANRKTKQEKIYENKLRFTVFRCER